MEQYFENSGHTIRGRKKPSPPDTQEYCILCCINSESKLCKSSSLSIKVITSLVKLLGLDESETDSVGYIDLFRSSNYCLRCHDLVNHIHSLTTLLESERNYINRLLVRNYGDDIEVDFDGGSGKEQEVSNMRINVQTHVFDEEPKDTSNDILKCLENMIPPTPAVPVPVIPENQEEQMIIVPKIEYPDFLDVGHEEMNEYDEDCLTNSTGDGLDFIGPEADEEEEQHGDGFPIPVNDPCPSGANVSPSVSSAATRSPSGSGWIKPIKTNTRTSFHPRPRCIKNQNRPTQALKNFECKICGARYARGSNYRAHMNLHGGGSSHACKYCKGPKIPNFNDAWQLRSHILSRHSNISPSAHLVPCDVEACTETFSSKITYARHMKIHDPTTNPGNICRICKIGFSRSDRMAQHMLKIHQITIITNDGRVKPHNFVNVNF